MSESVKDVDCKQDRSIVEQEKPHRIQVIREVHLESEKGEKWYSVVKWAAIMGLAMAYGWVPRGTFRNFEDDYDNCAALDGLKEDDVEERRELRQKLIRMTQEWPGCYDSNDQQVVTIADAHGLANALDSALKDELLWKSKSEPGEHYLVTMRNIQRTEVQEFATFCREGFQIF